MAEVQDRTSVFGKDILSRMLDLEKLSQVQRESKVNGATILTTAASSNNQYQMPKDRQQSMPQRSTMAPPQAPPRSKTVPNLKIDLSRTNSVREDAGANQGPESVSPSICHSPTWSVRGKEKGKQDAKKAAKEKKESEKKSKKEEEKKKLMMKSGKRLSKKPPPAMETQRLPVALSRPSESTASRSREPSVEDSRPSSKEGRRSSMSSITSMMRVTPPFMSRRNSASLPASPAQEFPPKSKEAAQKYEKPRVEPKEYRIEIKQSREAPTKAEAKKPSEEASTAEKKAPGQKARTQSNGSDDDTSYLKELKEFAYQLNGNMSNAKSAGNTPEATRPLKDSPLPSPMPLLDQPRQPSPKISTPATESRVDRPAPNQQQPVKSFSRPELRTKGVQDNTPRGYHYPTFTKTFTGEAYKQRKNKGSSPYSMAIPPTSSAPGLVEPNQNSYVRKQRLSQQQRSISGFREEMAVTQAMLQARTGPTMPPTPAESMESLGEGEGPASKVQDISRRSRPSEASTAPTMSSKESTSRHESLAESTSTHQQSRPSVSSTSNAKPQTNQVMAQVMKLESRPSFSLSRSLSFKSRKSESQGDKSQKSPVDKTHKAEPTSETQTKDGGRWFPLSNNSSKKAAAQQVPESPSKPLVTKKLAPPPIPLARSTTEPVLPTVTLPADIFEPNKPLYEPETTQAPAKGTRDPSPEVPGRSPLRDARRKSSAYSPKSSVDHGQPNPEIVVQGVDGDGLVRQASIKRPRSDPELNVDASVKETQPALDFLPQLKHQPLVKPKRTSAPKVSFAPEPDTSKGSSQFPVPASAIDFSKPAEILALPQPPFPQTMPGVRRQSAIRAGKRSSFPSPVADPAGQMLPLENKTQIAGQALNARPIAKMFVICCKCKYWHDLPSSFYEAMAVPRTISQEDGIAQSVAPSHGEDVPRAKVAGKVFTTVKCPWCEHGMSTACCAGWTSIVYLHERHH